MWILLFLCWADQNAQNAIKAQNAKLVAALKAGDAKAYADLFAPEAWILEHGAPIVKGQEFILRSRRNIFATAEVLAAEINSEEIRVSDDLAYERGTFLYTIQVRGQLAQTFTGKYVTIWVRQADGRWLIQGDVGIPD